MNGIIMKNKDVRHWKDIQSFIRHCNLVLIASARDLAILTQHNIDAGYIVSLSQKAETLEKLSDLDEESADNLSHTRKLVQELLIGIGKICHKVENLDKLPLRHRIYDRFRSKFEYWWLTWASY